MKPHVTAYRKQLILYGYLFVAPALLAMGVFVFFPFVIGLINSLYTGFGKNLTFVGLQNYVEILSASRFWNSIKVTLLFTLVYTTISGILGFLAANWLTRKNIRFNSLFISGIFLPYIITPAIATLVWQYMFNRRFGILNYMLTGLGLPEVKWLTVPWLAMTSLILVMVWFTVGYNMILFAAGIQAIPSDYYESAQLDGANSLQQMLHITLPLILPTLVFVLVISIMAGFVNSFVIAQILTDGGPFRSTEVLMLFIYKTAFEDFDIPKANALSLLMFALLFSVSYALQRWQDKVYQGLF
jgi:multiple sugar transport system permease protein